MNKIDRIQAKINELELEISRDRQKVESKERRERTRRIIQKGALLEKYFECEHLSIEDTEALLKMFSQYVNQNKPNKYHPSNVNL
ncbi:MULTISPECIES: hypothetical protein [Halobacillus]|uniref:hypothetical protein n=1 Tax=Halobacillus TaxID=45667 RepID=UPI0009A825EE|nr:MULTISPECIES: hypothetical protein [Halobacillus]